MTLLTRRARAASRLPMLGWLTVLWCLLWGEPSAANVASGLLIAGVLLVAFPLPPVAMAGRVRPAAVLRLTGYFAVQLIRATALVAWEAITPQARLQASIVAVPVRDVSDGLLTLVANAISLTPGTLTLEVDRSGGVLYLHVLHLGDLDDVRADVHQLTRLVLLAFGSAAAIAALAESPEPPRSRT